MFAIDLKSRKSISEQIIDQMKEMIVTGVMEAGDKAPSVRELAGELTVNPNTVQKAYRILEQQGYLFTARGRGTFVADSGQITVSQEEKNRAEAVLRDGLDQLYYLGVSREEARRMIEHLMEQREEWI